MAIHSKLSWLLVYNKPMQHTLCKHTCICTRTCAFAHCFTAVRDAPSRVPMLIVPASTRPRLCRSKQRKENSRPRSLEGQSRPAKRSHRTRSPPRSALATKWLPHHVRMLRGNARITAPCHWASISANSVASPNHQNCGRSQQAPEYQHPAFEAATAGCPGWKSTPEPVQQSRKSTLHRTTHSDHLCRQSLSCAANGSASPPS